MNRVAIDIDEVLVKFLYPLAKHHNKVHKLWSKPKYNYVYREVFDIDEPTSQRMVREFYQSKDFIDLKPMKGSQYAMYKLKRSCNKMYILTGPIAPSLSTSSKGSNAVRLALISSALTTEAPSPTAP